MKETLSVETIRVLLQAITLTVVSKIETQHGIEVAIACKASQPKAQVTATCNHWKGVEGQGVKELGRLVQRAWLDHYCSPSS